MSLERVRLDKWLWRARFFKTRALASEAVEAGRIRLNGRRSTKPGAGLKIGDVLTVRRGGQVFVIEILAFGERRGPASEAAELYREILENESDRFADEN